MKQYIYADHAATTPISEKAKEAMLAAMDRYGNPSSFHREGQLAKEALEQARSEIADCLHAKQDEIYFTSGGSEADNQAIRSAASIGAKKGKKHIITSAFEHHAVLHTLDALKKEGFSITYLDVHENGIIDVSELEQAIKEETCLVTIMYANNEIGTLQPVAEIGAICRRHKVLFHCDAVQAVGHIPVDVIKDQVDYLAFSAHKFQGPKGIGGLYVRKGAPLIPLLYGGAQEKGLRAGTENLPAIIAMAAALRDACEQMSEQMRKVSALRDQLIEGLSEIPHSRLNGDCIRRVPQTINFCFEGIEGESLLLWLDQKGIAASSGSACTSGSLDPSHVLLALGLPHEVAHGSLRLSIGMELQKEQIDYIIHAVKETVSYLRNISPVWEALKKGEKAYVIQ